MNRPRIALLTKHEKEKLIKPSFDEMGWRFIHTTGFDTDLLGNFSGELPRKLSPLDCAKKKAQIACELSDAEYGLGSEGSFYPSVLGFGTANMELIACVHRSGKLIAVGYHEAPVYADKIMINSAEDAALNDFIHNLPNGQGSIITVANRTVAKGVTEAEHIRYRLKQLSADEFSSGVEVSYDFRAHHCPSRREHINVAALSLKKKLGSCCPACDQRGFWPEESLPGLPCEWCSLPTSLIKTRIATCNHCGYQEQYPVEKAFASPQYCNHCNP